MQYQSVLTDTPHSVAFLFDESKGMGTVRPFSSSLLLSSLELSDTNVYEP